MLAFKKVKKAHVFSTKEATLPKFFKNLTKKQKTLVTGLISLILVYFIGDSATSIVEPLIIGEIL